MGVHSEIIIMKAFIFATVLAVAAAIPIEDTEEVKAAKAEFATAFAAAVAGEHAAHAPAAVATAYLADLPEVAEAKDAFRVVFDKYAAGEVALPVALAAPVAAPYWPGAYPYAHSAYAGHYGYPYAHAGYAGYAGYYGAYPYALPTVAVAPAKAE